jgi:uncharacterized protein
VIYLDSCAIVKLVVPEPESRALNAWLDSQPDELTRIDRFEINEPVRATAGAYIET